jgi:nicotinamide riboside kinase/4'-phosphopantetheinyl transferase EntD
LIFAWFMNENGKGTKKVQVNVPNLSLLGVHLALCSLDSDFAFPALSGADEARLARISAPGRKQHFLAARTALASADPNLAAELNYQGDRPILPSGYVSLSHGGSHAAALYHPHFPVGVDVEGPRAQLGRIAPKFLHQEEHVYLNASAHSEDFLRIAWGAKEAVFKAAQREGLPFAEGIRFATWPQGDVRPSGTFRMHLSDGSPFLCGAHWIPTSDPSGDCLVWALALPTHPHIVLTGPESTGKSSLLQALHAHLGWPFAPEAARSYLSEFGSSYTLEDVERIHALQASAQQSIIQSATSPTLSDTDALTTMIWAEEKFGVAPEAMRTDATRPLADFYLLCAPDLPWEADPLRENPQDRDLLFAKHEAFLRANHLPYAVVSGSGKARLDSALKGLEAMGFVG